MPKQITFDVHHHRTLWTNLFSRCCTISPPAFVFRLQRFFLWLSLPMNGRRFGRFAIIYNLPWYSPVLISPANVKLRLMMISKWNKSHLLCANANATEMEFFWHESDTRGGFIRLIPSGHNWQHDCECDSRSFPPRKWNINSERKIWTEKNPSVNVVALNLIHTSEKCTARTHNYWGTCADSTRMGWPNVLVVQVE